MFSGLKKFADALVGLAVACCIIAVVCIAVIYDISWQHRQSLFWINLGIISVPIFFALTAVALKKIISEMEDASQNILQRMKKIEGRLRQLEEEGK
ncbi:MAG: hypothetical protein ACOX8S_12740 [Christensenellales bacterium]|jgi:Na+/melibiose symporter-like transporter